MSKRFDRRVFLKGLGAGAATGVGSLFFGSKVAMGNTDRAPLRVMLVALQHGWGKNESFDRVFSGSEFNFTLPKPFDGFESIKDECVFIDGARGTLWGNAHDVSYSDIFTAAVPWGEGGSEQLGAHFPEPKGPSLDYVIGEHTQKPVLRLSARYRSWGRQTHPMCFDDRARLIDQYFKPRDAYDAIINPIRERAEPPKPGRQAVRNNLFQFLGRDTDRMLQKVSGAERAKLEDYLNAVNSLGDRILEKSDVTLTLDDIPERPENSPEFGQMLDHYFDLIRLSFRADTHRVAVLGLGQGVDNWQWRDESGTVQHGNPFGSDFHHEVAHYSTRNGRGLDSRYAYEGWVGWYVQKMVSFVNSLKAIPDVDGRSLLDNTLIMLTGEVGTGQHDTRSKVHTLIGGGDRLRRGRWIRVPHVPARQRDGVFIGGEDRAGNRVESGLNYGSDLSVIHTADVLAAVGRLAGANTDTFGLPANNLSPWQLDLS